MIPNFFLQQHGLERIYPPNGQRISLMTFLFFNICFPCNLLITIFLFVELSLMGALWCLNQQPIKDTSTSTVPRNLTAGIRKTSRQSPSGYSIVRTILRNKRNGKPDTGSRHRLPRLPHQHSLPRSLETPPRRQITHQSSSTPGKCHISPV